MALKQSIRQRLQQMVVRTTGLSLGLTCAIFIFLEWRTSLAAEKQAALSIGRITADASSAVLAFGNREEAARLLAAFRAEPDVRAAVLFDVAGDLFAEYQLPDATRQTPTMPRADGLYVEGSRLVAVHPVVERERRFGTLYLRTNLGDMYGRIIRYGLIAVLIFSSALIGAQLIGRFLQDAISRPILSLAQTAQSISQKQDYRARAEKARGGELQVLTTAFNQMLDTIQRQEEELRIELVERKRAQEAEAREKQLLATTLSSIGDAVIATNAQGEVTSLNQEAERLTGWSPADALGRPLPEVFRIIHEQTRKPAENPVEKVLALGTVVGLANHTVLISKDGRETPIDDSAAPIREPGAPLIGVVLVFRDFTERKQAEQILREREARERERAAELQAIMDAVPAAIWISRDQLCHTIKGNRASFELLRLPPHTNPSLSAPDSQRPTHFEVLCEGRVLTPEELPVQRAARGEQVHNMEEEIRFADGTSRYLLGNATPLRDGQGDLCGSVAAFVDISARKRAEEALRESEERFRNLVENAPFGIYIIDADFRIAQVNSGAQAAFRNVRPLIGHDFSKAMRILWVEPVATELIALFQRTLDTGVPYFSPGLTSPRHDLKVVESYEWQLHRIKMPDGRYGVVCYFFDATRLRKIEAALRQAHEQLANRAIHLEALVQERTLRLNETIGDLEAFSYSIVHDMRAPLRAMQSFAHLLAAEFDPLSPAAQNYLRRIKTAAERMDRLIQDGLNYSRVVGAELPLAPTDVAALLRGMIETYPTFQPPHALIELDGHIPLVHANEAALTQCISNLLGNAVKFVSQGVIPRVRVWAESRDDRIRLLFKDNGIGIGKDLQDRIFEIFQRLDTKFEGTGIGLAIVKKAAERLGGTVGVESEPGQGSTFWLELAQAIPTDDPTARPTPAS